MKGRLLMYKFEPQRVAGARTEMRITQDDMAKALGITRQTYSLKERGNRSFSTSELENIARVTNKPVEYFFLSVVTKSKQIV